VVRQQFQSGADERTGLRKVLADQIEAVAEADVAGAGHEQAEGDGLSVAVGELLVLALRAQKGPPAFRHSGKASTVLLKLLGHFVAEQTTEASRDVRKFRGGARRYWLPAKEVIEQRAEFRRRLEFRAVGFNVAFQKNDRKRQLAVVPEAEPVAIGVE